MDGRAKAEPVLRFGRVSPLKATFFAGAARRQRKLLLGVCAG